MRLIIQKSGKYRYVSFRESFWDKSQKKYSSRTVKNFGRLDLLEAENPNILEELRRQVDELNDQKSAEKEARVERRITHAVEETHLSDDLNADNRTVMMGLVPLQQIWHGLNLPRQLREFQKPTVNLPDAIFELVVARSLMPDSKLSQWIEHNSFFYSGQQHQLHQFYRALWQLMPHKDELIAYLSQQNAKQASRSITLALYDVTTLGFEKQASFPLLETGETTDTPNSDVVFGLLIDQNGIPVDYGFFSGNIFEPDPILKRFQKEYDIQHVFAVPDQLPVVELEVSQQSTKAPTIQKRFYQIGQAFRISKPLEDLQWNANRISAHFFVSYLALLLLKHLEKALVEAGEPMTTARIVEALVEAELIEVLMPNGQTVYAKGRTNGDFERICQAVELDVLPRLAHIADVKRVLKLKEP